MSGKVVRFTSWLLYGVVFEANRLEHAFYATLACEPSVSNRCGGKPLPRRASSVGSDDVTLVWLDLSQTTVHGPRSTVDRPRLAFLFRRQMSVHLVLVKLWKVVIQTAIACCSKKCSRDALGSVQYAQ